MPNKSLFDIVCEYSRSLVAEIDSLKERIPTFAGNKELQKMGSNLINKLTEVQNDVSSFQKKLDENLSEEENKILKSILKKWES